MVIYLFNLSTPEEIVSFCDLVMDFTALLIITELDDMMKSPLMTTDFKIQNDDVDRHFRNFANKIAYDKKY